MGCDDFRGPCVYPSLRAERSAAGDWRRRERQAPLLGSDLGQRAAEPGRPLPATYALCKPVIRPAPLEETFNAQALSIFFAPHPGLPDVWDVRGREPGAGGGRPPA